MFYVPFVAGASAFSVLNALGSIHCWYTSSRSIMLYTGALNTLIGSVAVAAYPYDPFLSNVYCSAASTCAAGQFFLHAARTPRMWRVTPPNALFLCWIFGLLSYGFHRGQWAYALRFD